MRVINERRSVRSFKDMMVEKEKIEKMLRAAMQAPSAGNQQPWEFLVVEEKDTLSHLAGMSPYSKMIEKAAGVIVVLGNRERMKYPENWEQDLGACTQNILLEATDLSLGTVWLGVAPLEDRIAYVREAFGLKENIIPYSIVVFGYPEKEDANKFVDRYDAERVHFEKY